MQGAVILLVEDDAFSRDMLSRRLRRRGFRVFVASTADEAIAIVRERTPDLVLMDISLGPDDGLQAVRVIRNDETIPPLPIVALTAHAMPSDHERSIDAGCNGFETKPVDFSRLLARIQSLLEASND